MSSTIHPRSVRSVWATLWTVAAFAIAICSLPGSRNVIAWQAIDPAEPEVKENDVEKPVGARPAAVIINVPLPIKGLVDTQVIKQIEHALQTLPPVPRPILIFEFGNSKVATNEEKSPEAGSQFERALSLARYLSGEKLSRVRTVAYLPNSVTGHAVLPVMACEQIIMHPDADLGNAGIDESNIDATLLRAYTEIAERRRTIPTALAIGMLDRAATVSRVQTADGVRFVLADELQTLQKAGQVSAIDTIVREGDLGLFSGRDLRVKYSLASHLATNHLELATALELPRSALDGSSLNAEVWRPIQVKIDGPIHSRLVTQIIRGVETAAADGTANIVLIHLRSAGGNLQQSLRLASFLARDLDSKKMRSVVFVQREARGDAALVALAADDLVITPDALLGGPGNANLSAKAIADSIMPLRALAQAKEREWSLFAAMIDPKLEVYRWTNERQSDVRFMGDTEWDSLPDQDLWSRRDLLPTDLGLKGIALEGTAWLQGIADDENALADMYGWEGPPLEIKSNWALSFIEFLAQPRLALVLLTVAWAALMIELSSPGVGVPGFIAGLCFLLFFWSQFLHGTAGFLEISLFLFGVTCVAIEIFALPGVGIFGFGGAFLIIASMVLASQTFVIPANAYQLRQLPFSLLTVAASAFGGLVALLIARRFLPQTPFFKRLLLQPPQGDDLQDLQRRESFGDWGQLVGKRGQTLTPLVPSGKARIGDEIVDVLSDGELLDRGATIEVIEVQGMRIVVRQV